MHVFMKDVRHWSIFFQNPRSRSMGRATPLAKCERDVRAAALCFSSSIVDLTLAQSREINHLSVTSSLWLSSWVKLYKRVSKWRCMDHDNVAWCMQLQPIKYRPWSTEWNWQSFHTEWYSATKSLHFWAMVSKIGLSRVGESMRANGFCDGPAKSMLNCSLDSNVPQNMQRPLQIGFLVLIETTRIDDEWFKTSRAASDHRDESNSEIVWLKRLRRRS